MANFVRESIVAAFTTAHGTSYFRHVAGFHLRRFHGTPSTSRPSLTIRHFAPKTKNYRPPRANVALSDTPVPQRIAVVGGGLAGLAVVYHLLYSTARFARKRAFDHESIRITLFDPAPPGTAGASAAAAGLLHEFRPRPKRKMWNHQKAIDAALHLLANAETCGQEFVSTPGLLKLAFDVRAIEDFHIAARRFPRDVELLEADEVVRRFPNVRVAKPGLFIRAAHVVDMVPYMQSLWRLCEQSGRVQWKQQSVNKVSDIFSVQPGNHPEAELSDPFGGPYDNVILCAGSSITQFTDLHDVPIAQTLGHNLILEGDQAAPDTSLLAGYYVVPQSFTSKNEQSLATISSEGKAPSRLIAGATHDHSFNEDDAYNCDTEAIKERLRENLLRLVPDLYNAWRVVGTQTGIRAIPPRSKAGSVPVLSRVEGTPESQSCWVFTGLGGRGLLYHAFLGRTLAHAVVSGLERHIPLDTRRHTIRFTPQDESNFNAEEMVS